MEIKYIFEITILFIAVICFFIWIAYMLYSIKLTNRIKSHTINLDNKNNNSYIDRVLDWYKSEKNRFINKVISTDKNNSRIKLSNTIDKIFLMFIILIIYLLICLFYLVLPSVEGILISMIIGYLIPTFKEIVNIKYKNKLINKELIRAISLLNNNLQSGKTIRESISSTSKKLEGPLKEEFEEVINDLNHGLSIHTAFDRMRIRTNNDDISYLTTILSIVEKTGGNIIEMFSYVETLFRTRKSLNQELESVIASSKLVFIILTILPIIVLIGMVFLYDNFINLFLTNPLGLLLGIIILILYIVYIIIINKIIKIEKY